MHRAIAIIAFGVALSACGGNSGGGGAPNPASSPAPAVEPTSFNLAAARQLLLTSGYDVRFKASGNSLDGSLISGELDFDEGPAVAVNGMFGGQMAAWEQTETVTGTLNGAAYSDSVVGYSSAEGSALGTVEAGETDVAQSPIEYPATIHIGDTGFLGTLICWDGVLELGTKQVSYVVKANPADASTAVFAVLENWTFATGTYSEESDFIITASGAGSTIGGSALRQSFLGETANVVFTID